MGYVKMPELFSPELVKTLAGNVYTVKEEQKHEDEMAAAWKEYLKPEKKCDKKEDDAAWKKRKKDDDVCCPDKVKFIFILDNAVVINVNAIAEEDDPVA